jgi:BASS family bile acid:Na+ symporter
VLIAQFTQLFPLWALLAAVAAYLAPQVFATLKPAIVPLLGLVMFGMGMTLQPASFVAVARRPTLVALGVALQFLVMPAAAWTIATLLGLSPQIAAGLILVGSCPGGTASNVICYLARGDVALSIALTTSSTLLAVLATPFLTLLYVGERVPVPAGEMLLSVLKIVLIPVVLGTAVNVSLGSRLQGLKRALLPLVSVLAIALIIAIIVALNRDQLHELAPSVAVAVALHNLSGLLIGYWLPFWLGFGPRIARTLAIEVGMQNSGLGVALAVQYFSPIAALPGALFSVWHNLSGSLLAALWRRRSIAEDSCPGQTSPW